MENLKKSLRKVIDFYQKLRILKIRANFGIFSENLKV